jgi:CobQ-like glutamine amidotransferase family enzyme
MVDKVINVGHLFPRQMNVYGDMGNVITLRYRLESRGIGFKYHTIDSIKDMKGVELDIVVGGGGQDSNQDFVQSDITKNSEILIKEFNNGLVGLMICGMYQLIGKKFVTSDGNVIIGAGLLDIETIADRDRLIGNVVIDSPFGELVGFENHSGKTYLGSRMEPLGLVVKGAGNNGKDKTEGVIYKNFFGSYLHGPLLAKNPTLADELIKRALLRKYKDPTLSKLNDDLEHRAHESAKSRPR